MLAHFYMVVFDLILLFSGNEELLATNNYWAKAIVSLNTTELLKTPNK